MRLFVHSLRQAAEANIIAARKAQAEENSRRAQQEREAEARRAQQEREAEAARKKTEDEKRQRELKQEEVRCDPTFMCLDGFANYTT